MSYYPDIQDKNLYESIGYEADVMGSPYGSGWLYPIDRFGRVIFITGVDGYGNSDHLFPKSGKDVCLTFYVEEGLPFASMVFRAAEYDKPALRAALRAMTELFVKNANAFRLLMSRPSAGVVGI